MIDLDSPVETVLGEAKDKRSRTRNERITEGLGLRTVGDLLRHFPRRYLETGTLTAVEELQEGQLLTVVGQISSSIIATYRDRRTNRTAYRVDVVVRAEGPSLRMSFFAKSQGMAQWHTSRMPVGRRGVFMGQVSRFRDEWQLTHPQMTLFGTDDEDADARSELSLDAIGDLYPIYPLTKGVESWDLQRAIAFARTVVDELPELLPESIRRDHDLVDARTALDLDPRARHLGPDHQGTAALPLRGGAGHPARAGPAAPVRPRTRHHRARRRRRRTARGVRRAAAVHAHRRPARDRRPDRGRPRAATSDEPACSRARWAPARPWSRCARCCASSTPGARPRCSRRPRCSPSSTTARSPRCSATSPAAACWVAHGPPTSSCSPAR